MWLAVHLALALSRQTIVLICYLLITVTKRNGPLSNISRVLLVSVHKYPTTELDVILRDIGDIIQQMRVIVVTLSSSVRIKLLAGISPLF